MRLLILGDVVGRPGREALAGRLPRLRRELGADAVIANAENASGGIGLTAKAAREILMAGVDVMTSGNHIFRHKEILPFFETSDRLLRPANYPDGAPGAGLCVYRPDDGPPYAVLNLLGRTYMEPVLDCPFRAADALLGQIPVDVTIRVVDFHAEATSEKKALAFFLDGRVSVVVGTHTHVQTADAQILPHGTAYLTDLGMCGPTLSALGMDPAGVVRRFVTGMPHRFTVAKTPSALRGAIADIDSTTGKAVQIKAWRHDCREN